MDLQVAEAKRRRVAGIEVQGHVQAGFLRAAENLLSCGGSLSAEVLDVCRRLIAHQASETAQASALSNVPCWPQFVECSDLLTSRRVANTSKWFLNKLRATIVESRIELKLILCPNRFPCVADVYQVSEYRDHAPLAEEIIAGRDDKVAFLVKMGINPNLVMDKVKHPDMGCDFCAEQFPQWKLWTFYDLAKVMATGSISYGRHERHQRIEMLLRQQGGTPARRESFTFRYGKIVSNTLPSRRLLYDRLRSGDVDFVCSLCNLFDLGIRNETYTEADDRFIEELEAAEAQRVVDAAVAAESNQREMAFLFSVL